MANGQFNEELRVTAEVEGIMALASASSGSFELSEPQYMSALVAVIYPTLYPTSYPTEFFLLPYIVSIDAVTTKSSVLLSVQMDSLDTFMQKGSKGTLYCTALNNGAVVPTSIEKLRLATPAASVSFDDMFTPSTLTIDR